MVRSLLLTFAMFLASGAVLAQTVLQGKVSDGTEPLVGATVKVMKGADFVRGTITDYDGNYRVSPLDPGTYEVTFYYTGFAEQKVTGVRVIVNTINYLDATMTSNTVLTTAEVVAFKVPLIEQDKTQGGQTLTSDQIRNLPTRSVNAIVATTAGTTSVDGGEVNIKGSRSNATNYYIDGIRVSGAMPPVQDIEQLQVITGGLGAEYGDVTGGVISLVTKGPASEYHGAIEVENSHGLDPYGWLLTTANVSGPLWKKKSEDGSTRTVVGFRLSGQYLSQKDDDPPAIPVYRAKGDGIDVGKLYSSDQAVADAERAKLADPNNVLGRIQANPIIFQNGFQIAAAENLTNDSVDVLDYLPYEDRQDIDITGKLDFRLTDNIDLSVTGTYKDIKNQFTPGTPNEATGAGGGWRLLNSHYNPTTYGNRYRGIARFRHRLGSSDPSGSASSVSITNASYQLQFGFERATGETYDPRHKDRFFDYGYVGTFDYNFIPVAGPNNQTGEIEHLGTTVLFTGWQPGYTGASGQVIPNADLVAYNRLDAGINALYAQNGTFSNVYNNIWSGMHSNTGMVYNRYNKNEEDIMTITASAGFDLKLGRSGVHSIQFGLLNEERTNRNWTINPSALWLLARQSVDDLFNGLDTVVIGKFWDPFWSPILGDSIDQRANFVLSKEELGDNKFAYEVRDALDIPYANDLNIDGLRPDQLSLDMFSPRELTDQNLVGYYGYDFTGKRLDGNFSFNDFFTSRDEDGVRNFPVAALNPIYQAAFIKDKFTFNKMIFSLGLRVERFDLNTKVMKDQYSLYQVMTVDDFYNRPNTPARPSGVGDDFKVYVNSSTDDTPKAFRDGDTWYFADGRQANDGSLIFGGGVVAPYLLDTVTGDNITDPNFNTNFSFEDYTPQVYWLPRLAFSFPISEEANFFAHYDILVQRPPSNWQVTPLNYFYFYEAGRTPGNNANLKPERVVDYEVGFQQRLNQNSALKFSAYYREMRDMIQRRTILYVPVIGRYDTYGNVDFGTVKGFTVQYDLRRIRNTELRIAYTLQFADGTGSNADSQRGLTTRGNIRSLYPLDFDERHNISAILDYRFGANDRYNGPRVGGKDILSNFGINFQLTAASGRPYTAEQIPTRFGGTGTLGAINGNRLPWRTTLDMRIDKSFNLSAANKRPLNLNVYFRVSNLLDQDNIIGVYSVTGSPTDDGFLATPIGQSNIESAASTGRNPQAFTDSYSWVERNYNNFTLPRRMYIGAALEF